MEQKEKFEIVQTTIIKYEKLKILEIKNKSERAEKNYRE